MFKKKAGPAFKPKAVTRPRPVTSTNSAPASGHDPASASASQIQPASTVPASVPSLQDAHSLDIPSQTSGRLPASDAVSESAAEHATGSSDSALEAGQKTAVELPAGQSLKGTIDSEASPAIQEGSSTRIDSTLVISLPTTCSTSSTNATPTAVPSNVTTTSSEILSVPRPTVAGEPTKASFPTVTRQPSPTPASILAKEGFDKQVPVADAPDAQPDSTPPLDTSKPAERTSKRRRPSASASAGQDNTEETGTLSTTTRKRQRKKAAETDGTKAPARPARKRKAAAQDDQEQELQDTTPKMKRRQRSVTPDDAETRVVNLQKLKMSDLTRDLHIGKKFSRHEELKERERLTKARKKNSSNALPPTDSRDGESGSTADSVAPGTPQPDKASTPSAAGKPSDPASSGPTSGPTSGLQFQIVDGQIVVNQQSLVMDRHARAAAAAAGQELEEVEENDFTRLVTSSSYRTGSKLFGANHWSLPDTELFYRGLHMFGTDFETIAKMFPGRQRRHVKMKFNREERRAPARVDAALTGRKNVKMDMNEYRAWTGLDFKSVDEIMGEQERREREHDEELRKAEEKEAEEMNKKREELFRDGPKSGEEAEEGVDEQ